MKLTVAKKMALLAGSALIGIALLIIQKAVFNLGVDGWA